jgi:hypothetical protein
MDEKKVRGLGSTTDGIVRDLMYTSEKEVKKFIKNNPFT